MNSKNSEEEEEEEVSADEDQQDEQLKSRILLSTTGNAPSGTKKRKRGKNSTSDISKSKLTNMSNGKVE